MVRQNGWQIGWQIGWQLEYKTDACNDVGSIVEVLKEATFAAWREQVYGFRPHCGMAQMHRDSRAKGSEGSRKMRMLGMFASEQAAALVRDLLAAWLDLFHTRNSKESR